MIDPDNPLAHFTADTEAEQLLLEWLKQWHERDDMPAKMGDGLHVRTMVYLAAKAAQQ